jgi:hypothetical protein
VEGNISSGLKIGVTVCIVVAVVAVMLVIFQVGMYFTREYIADTTADTASLYNGEVGSLEAYVGTVQIPMIYNALVRSGDNWVTIEVRDNGLLVEYAGTADCLLDYFDRRAGVTIEGDKVVLKLEKVA